MPTLICRIRNYNKKFSSERPDSAKADSIPRKWKGFLINLCMLRSSTSGRIVFNFFFQHPCIELLVWNSDTESSGSYPVSFYQHSLIITEFGTVNKTLSRVRIFVRMPISITSPLFFLEWSHSHLMHMVCQKNRYTSKIFNKILRASQPQRLIPLLKLKMA